MSTKLVITIEVQENVNRRVLHNILASTETMLHIFIRDEIMESATWNDRIFGRNVTTTVNIDNPKS